MHSIVLLPGLACDGGVFSAQVSALAPLHRVHVADVHARQPTLAAMAAALLAEQPGDHVLVGASMGGMLALEIVRQAPRRVRGIALLGSTARADSAELIALRTQACELFAGGRMDEVLRANVLLAFHPQGAHRAALAANYLAMIGRAGAGQLIAQNRAVMARIDSRPHLGRITCPTLVACGDGDLLTPPELSQEMASLIPGARLAIVPGAGHMMTMEQPERVNALLLDWLAGIRV